MMSIKNTITRFRAWQRNPYRFKPLGNDSHHCLNCGLEYVGKFCPRCSQPAQTRCKVGWGTVIDGIKDAFDLETNSLVRTFCYLLLRPGYLIRDFLNGKRKACTPPVNTLLMVGVAFVLLQDLFGARMSVIELSLPISEEGYKFYNALNDWNTQNKGWQYLLLSVFFMIPTWLLFRHSPRHPRHTLVEGLFIQIFLFMLNLLLAIIFMVIGCKQPNKWASLLMPLYCMFTFGPLFGYNWWSTLWRSVAVILTSVLMIITIIAFIAFLDSQPKGALVVAVVSFTISSIIITIGYLIGRNTERRHRVKAS